MPNPQSQPINDKPSWKVSQSVTSPCFWATSKQSVLTAAACSESQQLPAALLQREQEHPESPSVSSHCSASTNPCTPGSLKPSQSAGFVLEKCTLQVQLTLSGKCEVHLICSRSQIQFIVSSQVSVAHSLLCSWRVTDALLIWSNPTTIVVVAIIIRMCL